MAPKFAHWSFDPWVGLKRFAFLISFAPTSTPQKALLSFKLQIDVSHWIIPIWHMDARIKHSKDLKKSGKVCLWFGKSRDESCVVEDLTFFVRSTWALRSCRLHPMGTMIGWVERRAGVHKCKSDATKLLHFCNETRKASCEWCVHVWLCFSVCALFCISPWHIPIESQLCTWTEGTTSTRWLLKVKSIRFSYLNYPNKRDNVGRLVLTPLSDSSFYDHPDLGDDKNCNLIAKSSWTVDFRFLGHF